MEVKTVTTKVKMTGEQTNDYVTCQQSRWSVNTSVFNEKNSVYDATDV